MQELEQLRQLVFSGGFDEESKKDVLNFEKRLHEVAVKENLKDTPVFKDYIDWLQAEVDRCNLLLQNDRTLTDRQRDELFAKKDICDRFLSIFNGSHREQLESAIKEALARAKNS